MISYLKPTIRGEMLFTQVKTTNLASSFGNANQTDITEGAGGETTSINVTGTTVTYSTTSRYDGTTQVTTGTGSNTGTSNQTSSASSSITGSGSTAKTLFDYTTTTATANNVYRTTKSENLQKTRWTTQSYGDSFRFTTSLFSTTGILTTTTQFQATRTRDAIKSGAAGTVTANVYDTVCIAEYNKGDDIFFQSPGNEYLVAISAPIYASDWNLSGSWANGLTIGGEEITMTADVGARDVFIVGPSVTESTSSTSTEYETLTYQAPDNDGATFSGVDSAYLPNQSFVGFYIASSASEVTVRNITKPHYFVIHHGNTIATTSVFTNFTTATWALFNGDTYSDRATSISSVTRPTTIASTRSSTNVSLGGNTTFERKEEQQLGVGNTRPVYANYYDLFLRDIGSCYVFKSCGAVVDGQTGASATADNAPIAGSFFAALSRQPINLTDAEAVFEGEFPQAAGQLGPGLFTLLNTTNSSVTIEVPSVTYSTTASANETTVETTQSFTVGVEGEAQVGFVGAKNILGGKPESLATFYQRAKRGVYISKNHSTTGTTLIDGLASSYTHGDAPPSMMLINDAFVSISHNLPQITTVSRNPYLNYGPDGVFDDTPDL
jgi:hypothetical protein